MGYITLLMVKKLLIFNSFGSTYLLVDQNLPYPYTRNFYLVLFSNFQEGVLIFATQHFISLIRKLYFPG